MDSDNAGNYQADHPVPATASAIAGSVEVPQTPPSDAAASYDAARLTPPVPQINVLPNTPPTAQDSLNGATPPPPIPPRPESVHTVPINTTLPPTRNSSTVTPPQPRSIYEPARRPTRSPSPILVRGDDNHSGRTHSPRAVSIASPDRPYSSGSGGVQGPQAFIPAPGPYDPPPGPPPGPPTRGLSVYTANETPMPPRTARTVSYDRHHTNSRHNSMNGNGNGIGYANGQAEVPMSVIMSRRSLLDHNVPIIREDESLASSGKVREKNVEERLRPTLEAAEKELRNYQLQARATGWSLNFAIGMQVVLGALTTGVSAATSGRNASIATSVLGGMSTLAASYLAKARGSGEPEASNAMVKDLESFVRDCKACMLDKGHLVGSEYDPLVQEFRDRFEQILGNSPKSLTDRLKERFHPH